MNRVLVGAGPRTGEPVRVEEGIVGPVRFWRGQGRYEVGGLIGRRVEPAPRGPDGAEGPSREVWRVEAVRAGRSRTSFAGVFDLSREAADGAWLLVRVHD